MKFILALCLVAFVGRSTSTEYPELTYMNQDLIKEAFATTGPQSRIINGDDSLIFLHPWQLSLKYRGSHICGAVMVDSHVAITAAHCVVGGDPSLFTVNVGSAYLSRGTSHEVFQIIAHENYNVGPGVFPNDIAVILFDHSILQWYLSPAHLPDASETYEGESCVISGWGSMTYQGCIPNELQHAHTSIISNEACGSIFGPHNIVDGHVCIYNEENNSCNGDSGGPLTCDRDHHGWSHHHHELVGVTSWGVIGCPLGYPSGYTRVSEHLDWIHSHTGL